jgi:hypothetical protein
MSRPSDPFDLIRAELSKLEARPGLVKASPSARDQARCDFHAGFVAAVDHLIANGWNITRVADALGTDRTTVSDWLRYGDESRKQLPGWVIRRLPAEARAVFMRHMLSWSEAPSLARVG